MIELYEHNKDAYEKVKGMFQNENRCSVIHPTGTGKSYIALKWILDNKDKRCVYVTSHLAIKDQLERTIRDNNLSLEKDFPNLEIITYSKLLKENDIDADMIVLDEFHRGGAPKWREALDGFLEKNKDAKVLGLTATPVRYLNRNRDMSDEIFYGNVASHITLPKAIAEGILPPPKYINAIYSFKEDIEKLERKISRVPDEEEKKELEDKLKLAKRTIEKAETLDDIFEKYMNKENGKYLVFCRDIDHLNEMKEEANNMFSKINTNMETYYIHSLEDEEQNKYTLDRFHYVKDDKLKLLYSVGMLNEGVHVEDIDGVIMLRPTSSPILYQQQLGRALTTGKIHESLVFDVVNNIECLNDVEQLRDTVIKTMEKSNKPRAEIERMKESFKIIDDYKEISTLIKKLDIGATYGWEEKFELLKKYVEEHNGKTPGSKESQIGMWLDNQKSIARKGEISEERLTKLNLLLGEDWYKIKRETSKELTWEDKFELLVDFIEKHNGDQPRDKEPIIGRWFSHQKEYARNGTLSQERLNKLVNLLGENWLESRKEKEDNEWNKNLQALNDYINNPDNPNHETPNQKSKIGKWFNTQKIAARNGKLDIWKIEKLSNLLGEDWLKTQAEKDAEEWENKIKILEKYLIENGGETPIATEPTCGGWLVTQRVNARKGKLDQTKIKRLAILINDENWYKKNRRKVKNIKRNENLVNINEDITNDSDDPISDKGPSR